MSDSIIFKEASTNQWLEWQEFDRVWHITQLKNIVPTLTEFKGYLQKNKIIFGFIAYEAAAAFNNTLTTKSVADYENFPLAWFTLLDYKKAIRINVKNIIKPTANIKLKPEIDYSQYLERAEKIKNHLIEGDSYQVNFSFRMRALFKGSLKGIFLNNININPLPYAAYIENEIFAVCSLSPELFFKKNNYLIECHPMKGTISRGKYLTEDKNNFKKLKNSIKERAENTMILDMIRNDLGQISQKGSVRPVKMYEIEKYPTAWQMISSVTAKTNTDIVKILKALFPGASITGAPKRRTMEIITALENSCRKLYTGCIGAIYPDNKAVFNIAIRTLIKNKQNNQLEYGTGSAITIQSNIADEYKECLLKSTWPMFKPTKNKFCLLETILLDNGSYAYLNEHLKRLADSAKYWDFIYDKAKIINRLNKLALSEPALKLKIRLTLSKTGRIKITKQPFILKKNSIKTISLAPYAINANNKMLYHKTTNRQLYKNIIKNSLHDDVLMYNQKNEITESTVANVAIKIGNQMFTPPVICGLLPGSMRAYLIKQKRLKEKKLPLKILTQCNEIYLFNSVRGMQKVKLDKTSHLKI